MSILPSVSQFLLKTSDVPGTSGAAQIRETRTMSIMTRFLHDEAGATAIEYGLIAAGISVAIIATVAGLGSKLKATFTAVDGALP
jgi:pilus assembly protein Flp/PilA